MSKKLSYKPGFWSPLLQKPGFFINLWDEKTIIFEPGFWFLHLEKPVFFINLGNEGKLVFASRFLIPSAREIGFICSDKSINNEKCYKFIKRYFSAKGALKKG
ncbi:hypothetical protein [Laspinema olomoucense]|uniref:hypothetical protein n=1 Tax=Laspinema olomoucense TaxID=3231600 RepID=UPI0021BAE554|nr:hypothetical protein [Laspinema sp. D3c]MCT7994030.1 hypothetical protein [Laspinema sp. D3c]